LNHYTDKMLEIRPNCELCDKDLLPEATDACICTYECTFCRRCVDEVLNNVCPNCGGGFVSRPIRPKTAYRKNVSLANQKASTKRIHSPYSHNQIQQFSDSLKHISPEKR